MSDANPLANIATSGWCFELSSEFVWKNLVVNASKFSFANATIPSQIFAAPFYR